MNISKINKILIPLVIVCIGHFLVDVMIGIYPVYKTLAHINLAAAGIIGGISSFAGEGMQILFGTLSDKGYRKALILVGIMATVASAFLFYTSSYFAIFALYLITCTGSGAFHPCAASLVSELSLKNKGLFISLFTSAGAFGMAFSQIIFTSAHDFFHGNLYWLALPAASLVLFALFRPLGSKKLEKEASIKTSNHFNPKLFLEFFKWAPLRNLYFTQVCNASILWGTMFLLPDLLSSRGFDPWICYGGGHMMLILGAAFMMIPAGSLSDRFSCRTVIFTSMLIGLSAFYSLLFFPELNNFALLATLATLGASLGIVQPVAISLGTTLAPDHKGMISAFLMGMVWCISEGFGQIGGGCLTTCFSEDAPAKALAILGSFFLLGVGFSYCLPENEKDALPIKT